MCNLYGNLIAGGKWLFVGQLDYRFLPYLVDVLLHVRSKVQGKFDCFLATCIENLAIDLIRGQCIIPTAVIVFRCFYRSSRNSPSGERVGFEETYSAVSCSQMVRWNKMLPSVRLPACNRLLHKYNLPNIYVLKEQFFS